MPALTSGKVLVTGANGYIAVWVVEHMLKQGFAVRGTVRAENKAAHLRETFAEYGDKFEVVIVEDITKHGAFDRAVVGVDAIAHTASPFHMKADDPDEIIVPALHGTTRILESALAYAPGVQRIVITGSCAAVLTASPEPRTFSEVDWNEASIAEVKEKGRAALAINKYRTSKTLAERAAWAFVAQHKGQIGWDLVVLNPPFVFGPSLHSIEGPDSLNESLHDFFHTVFKGSRDKHGLTTLGSCWIDVRDLADAHVLALLKQEAGGERIIVSAGPYIWQDWVNDARKIDSSFPPGDETYKEGQTPYPLQYNVTKAARILGLKYISKEETLRDMISEYKSKGWLSA